jgi:hypothetical protein
MSINDTPGSSGDVEITVTLSALSAQLSETLSNLLDASRATSDVTTLLQLNNETRAIQVLLNQATHLQMSADDANFAQGLAALKTQSAMLDEMEAQIKTIVKDVGIAASIIGGIAQAIKLVAKL